MVDSTIDVRLLEREDIGATAVLLAAAMDDDPAYGFLFPRGDGRRAGLEDFFARNLRTHLPYRCTYVGVVGSKVVATITMRPPDGLSISLLTMIRRGLLPFALAHGRAAVRRLFVLKDAYDAIEARLARGERHWLVHMMAVDPARQGRGLGSRLLERTLDTTVDAKRTGTPPAILTTHNERNVVFYQRAGFEVDRVEDVSLMGAAPHRVWCMRRRKNATMSGFERTKEAPCR
jgi:ribosomal protein S18 acetylase RimI-like enzyme